ncbi:hypothetical protein BN863_13390 [Formosa agariphila KMM 3901]|uniref:Uncharacterized protein n=2 Tax=Formosa TaxID=225842 RepID=T2KKU2_FORAG|nr:hypothetical protein BN863_13390 [Formosa agariphila KMM 3901]
MLAKDHTFSVIQSDVFSVDSLVVCLFPTPVDYANISPIVDFEGSSILYRINNEAFIEYSASEGENIDFSYPNIVDFKISALNDSESKVYRIIVDTEQPILFNNSEITIPDSPTDSNYNGLNIDTWKNVGNYPIRLTYRTTEYVDVNTPETDANNIFSSTLTTASNIINPNEEGQVNVFTTSAATPGLYTSTALFNLNFNENLGYIVYDDTTNTYVKDIGYGKATLKMNGNKI